MVTYVQQHTDADSTRSWSKATLLWVGSKLRLAKLHQGFRTQLWRCRQSCVALKAIPRTCLWRPSKAVSLDLSPLCKTSRTINAISPEAYFLNGMPPRPRPFRAEPAARRGRGCSRDAAAELVPARQASPRFDVPEFESAENREQHSVPLNLPS